MLDLQGLNINQTKAFCSTAQRITQVNPAQHNSAARVRAFVDFMAEAFRPARP
jgi:hypothetical protein